MSLTAFKTFANLARGIASYLDYNFDIIKNAFGQPNGFATLDGAGKVPTSQLISVANADTVDNFHASQTPAVNTIPVTDAAGALPLTGGGSVSSGGPAAWPNTVCGSNAYALTTPTGWAKIKISGVVYNVPYY